MQAAFLPDFQRLISSPRFDAFRDGGRDVDAVAHHLWNTALCEALYPVFQILEVGFRNAVHREIGRECGTPDWLCHPPATLRLRETDAIEQARQGLLKERKPVDEGRMVAKLSFGFWTCLLDKPYDQLWHRIIAGVVPRIPRNRRTRHTLSSHMHDVRKLRNLAFHHHAIWHSPRLAAVHGQALEVLDWLGLCLISANAVLDRFPQVLGQGPSHFRREAKRLALPPLSP